MGEMADSVQLKDDGNKHFQAGDMENAIECYSKALKVCKDKKVQAVIYRNRSACFLKKVLDKKQIQLTNNHSFLNTDNILHFRKTMPMLHQMLPKVCFPN